MLGRHAWSKRIVFCAALAVVLVACVSKPEINGDGQPAGLTRSVSLFSQLQVNLEHAEVILLQGDSYQVSITGEQSLIERIRLKSTGQLLKVDTLYRLQPSIPLTVQIQTPRLDLLTVEGNSRVVAPQTIATEYLKLDVSGDSTVDLRLQAGTLSVRASGTSYTILLGDVGQAEFNLSGAASASASGMEISQARITMEGATSAQLHVMETVDANTAGSSQLQLSGPAKIGHYSSSGESSLSLQR